MPKTEVLEDDSSYSLDRVDRGDQYGHFGANFMQFGVRMKKLWPKQVSVIFPVKIWPEKMENPALP